MKRITFDGLFCDIAMCKAAHEDCPHGICSQRQTWERLKLLEDVLGDNYDLDRLRQMVQAEREGSLLIIGLGIKEAVYTPPADSAPVVHARWVPEYHRDRVLLYHCSRCGRKLLRFRDPREATYCFCGAKMDLREDDDE